MKIDVYHDAACWNKDGKKQHMGIGIAVIIDGCYESEYSRAIYEYRADGTNNVGEVLGCLWAMKVVVDLKKEYPEAKVTVFTDSQFTMNMVNGVNQIKEPKYIPLNKEVQKWKKMANVERIDWLPREENKYADKLSKIGLKLYTDAHQTNSDNTVNEKGIQKVPGKSKRNDISKEIKQIATRNSVA